MIEKELIDGIIARDKTAVQLLVNKYHQQVIKTAYYFVRDMNDAEDLAQDVCVEVLESINSFRQTSSLSTWIYRITVNKSLNHIRRNRRKQFIERIELLFSHPSEKIDHAESEPVVNHNILYDQERKKILEAAIQGLPENQRIAFVLSKFEGLPYKQIAEIMKVSLPAVESYLQRAKQNLQKKLITYFVEYSTQKPKR